MPDEPEKPKNLPGRQRPLLSELSKETREEDLWDLEDNSNPSTSPPPAQAGLPREPLDSQPDVSAEASPAASPAPIDQASPSSVPEEDHGENLSAPHEPQHVEPTTPPEKSEETSSAPAPASRELGKSEKIGLAAFGVVFLLLAIWWGVGLFSSVTTTRMGDDQPEFPAEGKFVTINSAETYWRKPIREGANPDVARMEVEFIPVINVLIESGNTGVLRAIFRNEQGEFVGDSISKKFSNGVFEQNSQTEIEFSATDGFTSSAEFNGYRVGTDRWSIEVFEGPSTEASGSEFNLLFTAPISPNLQ
ncbi:hypothetical protein ACFQY0_00785 [Haloferula chungangensis]|uniref:Uncharacterized protein n=1 Tax=Haloferula chungangensis TaxID=1048331 RepID=A0ABW2L2A4_9BACT